MRRLVWLIVVPLLTVLAACTPGGSSGPIGTQLNAPTAGYMFVPTWLPNGWIYFGFQPADTGQRVQIWRTRPGGSAQRVDLPSVSGCRFTDYRLPSRLPDGRLGLTQACVKDDPAQDWNRLVAVDTGTMRVTELVNVGLHNPADVTWAPGLAAGFISYSDTACASIAPVTAAGIGVFAGPVTIGGRQYRVDYHFVGAGVTTCDRDQIRANLMRLLPDGHTLLFMAALHSGTSEPWNLYAWDVGDGQPRSVVTGFADVLGIDLAPDGKSLAVAATRDGRAGVWRVDLPSGGYRKIGDGRFAGLAVAPSGKSLVGIAQDGSVLDNNELRVFPFGGQGE